MDISRKANREDHEKTLQYRSKLDVLLVEELAEKKLAELHSSIEQLKQTSAGSLELDRRTKLFGECIRTEEETSGQFYARMRHWMDDEMPPTKSPLHAPRQTDDED